MKVYKFKCKDCGSKSYKKIDDNTYQCEYCGQFEKVFFEKQKEEPKPEPKQELATKVVSQTNENIKEPKEKKKKDSSALTNSIINLIVCFFAGEFGVHKFLQGKVGMGILYLFTFGLFGIGWLVDVIKGVIDVLRKSVDYFNN